MPTIASTVLVTGASRGIGLEFVRQYRLEGRRVIAACRSPERAQALNRLAEDAPARLQIVALDEADTASATRATRALQDQPVDVLLHCTGVMGGAGQRLGRLDYTDWARRLEINTLGTVRVIEALSPRILSAARAASQWPARASWARSPRTPREAGSPIAPPRPP